MPSTLSDVAAAAGVSVSAVSRVLSRSPSTRVSPETRQRIEDAAARLGYRPNFAGRALKLARSNVIALIVPDVTNAIFTELTRGVEDAASTHDYVVLLGRSEDMQPGGHRIAQLIGEGRVDGMLVQLPETDEREEVPEVFASSAPVVLINSFDDGRLSSVSLPDAAGARLGVEHLLELGHRRLGLLGGSASAGTSAERERGFRNGLDAASVPVEERWITRLGYTASDGRSAIRQVLDQPDPPSGVLVANLNAAIGALAEARALGIRVPEDLSIVALHDAWTAEHTSPALTTVRMPLYELGRSAVELIIGRLAGAPRTHQDVVDPPPRLVLRSSTAPPR